MKRVLLACSTIRKELEAALASGERVPDRTEWIESGLHDSPERLRAAIQEKLDRIEDGALVLCGFGTCGNAIVGLNSGSHTLLIPRVDDCITWLAGSLERRKQWEQDGAVYYMTPAWAAGEHSLYGDYRYAVDKYGKETADDLYERMLKHYRYLGIVDSGVYDFEAFAKQMEPQAKDLKLSIRRFRAALSWMEALFEEEPDETRFWLIPSNTTITTETLMH